MCVLLCLTGLGSGCADAAPARPRGGTWYGDGNPPPTPLVEKHFGAWQEAKQVDELILEREAAPSEHLGGGFSAEIRVNSDAKGYAERGRPRPLPEGAVIVEVLRIPGSDSIEAFFVMEKRAVGYDAAGDDWEYLVVGPDAQIEDRGPIELCARCHAEAATEHLFGPHGVL